MKGVTVLGLLSLRRSCAYKLDDFSASMGTPWPWPSPVPPLRRHGGRTDGSAPSADRGLHAALRASLSAAQGYAARGKGVGGDTDTPGSPTRSRAARSGAVLGITPAMAREEVMERIAHARHDRTPQPHLTVDEWTQRVQRASDDAGSGAAYASPAWRRDDGGAACTDGHATQRTGDATHGRVTGAWGGHEIFMHSGLPSAMREGVQLSV